MSTRFGPNAAPISHTEHSAIAARRSQGRGRGRGRDFRGRGFFLVVVDSHGLTRDHVSVLVVGGTTMCLKMVDEVQEAQVGSGGYC